MGKRRTVLLSVTAGILLGFGPGMAGSEPPAGSAGKEARPLSKDEMVLVKMDTDKDGKISKTEYEAFSKASMERRFKAMDKDGDGYLTKEEALSAKAQKKKGTPKKKKGQLKDAPQSQPEGK